jgi:ABC-type nitrate/sulfonate/bicarbonate transport system substrate-binding protein
MFIADDQGLWKKYGLNSVDTTIVSSTQMIPLFLAGRAHIATIGGYIPLPVIAAGGKSNAYGWIEDTYTYQFFVQPSIKDWADLKGKAIGISSPGGLPHLAAVTMLKRNGIQANEVTFIAAGDVSKIVGALVAGQIAGGAFGPPATDAAKSAGLKMLADMQPLKIPTAAVGLVGNPEWVQKNPNAALAYVKGVLEGIAIMLTNKPLAIQVLAKKLNLNLEKDKVQLESTWQQEFEIVVRPADIVSKTSQAIFDDMLLAEQLNGRKATGIDISQIHPQIDLIAELQKRGFFKYLDTTYGKLPPRP